MNIAGFVTWRTVSLGLLLAAVGGSALAHTQNGSLGAGATATDYYQVTCTDDGSGPPGSLVTQVTSLSSSGGAPVTGPSAPLMRHLPSPVSPSGSIAAASVVVHKGNVAITSSDLTGADADGSPPVYVNGGDGVYDVFVNKATSGSVNYTLTFHCMTGVNGSGIHTGSDVVIKQRGAP